MRYDAPKSTRTHAYEDPTDQGVGSSNLLAHVLKGILVRECLFPYVKNKGAVAKLDRERGGSDFATAPFGFIFPWPSASGRGLSGGFPETGRLR